MLESKNDLKGVGKQQIYPMKGRILIIEDEEGIREMLGYTLMKEGYQFDEADSVEQAQPLINSESPDLILFPSGLL